MDGVWSCYEKILGSSKNSYGIGRRRKKRKTQEEEEAVERD